jgi:hypothetical protein
MGACVLCNNEVGQLLASSYDVWFNLGSLVFMFICLPNE